ncbi:hypothetical protein J6TS1_25650 [Siminovitchia terrae]|uniref:Uncharacterized protein n=1 Tax=Siminovitchia terrae TaxID=1914933 RepID=A0ABQ4KXJ3_SIMTE|nr:hypothetical protein J6TS1_25650 [Siminovitchia terrae]
MTMDFGWEQQRNFNFIQQKSPPSVSGEMTACWYSFSGGSNPD